MQFIKCDKYEYAGSYINQEAIYYNINSIHRILKVTNNSKAEFQGMKSAIEILNGKTVYSTLEPEDLIQYINKIILKFYTYIP